MMAPRRGHIFRAALERFEERYIPEPNSGCWLWTGTLNNAGYGRFWFDGKYGMAHRASYEMKHGKIEDGLVIDHLCRVPCCVNPDHLEPVTNRENTLRGKISALRPERIFCPRGHPQNEFGYIDSCGARQCRVCLHLRQKAYYLRKKAAKHVL